MSDHPNLSGASNERELFLQALERSDPAERTAFLNAACGADVKLRRTVEDLLRNADDNFMEKPASAIETQVTEQRLLADAPPQFRAGDLFGRRYRIVGLLAEGGMGRVYRADDLKLGQSVALKFLPPRLAADPASLLRFRSEVRIAREISHPNVCRVYDIGESDSEHFISMEFVDGEDLASLLRRIGRLPQDKALEIARQLCAGLNAAHGQGVLHRDLKPANVMINGRGKVRITDFGIAAMAGHVAGRDIRAGTPSYMAPEQLRGEEVTIRSDIYSLGLVLYELFTGKKAIDGNSITQVERAHFQGTPPTPAHLIKGLDPQVEQVILRCLEPDPKNRPRSAMAVAAALPGNDLLAEAVAAGETPSPELLAEAGESGSLRAWISISCLAAVVAGVAGMVALKDHFSVLRFAPFKKPAAVLADRAEQISRRLRYTNAPVDTAYWFKKEPKSLEYLTNWPPAERWKPLASGQPAAIVFAYRSASEKMRATSADGRIEWGASPPFSQPGMRRLRIDPEGRLLTFQSIPPRYVAATNATPPEDWSTAFIEAGLNITNFTPATPLWTPDVPCDKRIAWTGSNPLWSGETLRVEAASYAGEIVAFDCVPPWRKPLAEKSAGANTSKSAFSSVAGFCLGMVLLSIVAAGAYLARKNLREGRGDRVGARRLGLFVFVIYTAQFLFTTHSFVKPTDEEYLAKAGAAFFAWLFYLAVEPYARRHWPHTLVSWSRLLAGRLWDPKVGRDILIGCLAGLVFALYGHAFDFLPGTWTNDEIAQFEVPGRDLLFNGGGHVIAGALDAFRNMGTIVGMFLFLLVLRMLLKRDWLVVTMFVAFWGAIAGLEFTGWIGFLWWLGFCSIVAIVPIRFGLLALAVMFGTANLMSSFPATFDTSAWWAGIGAIGPAIVLALAAYGSWTAAAGHALFRDEVRRT